MPKLAFHTEVVAQNVLMDPTAIPVTQAWTWRLPFMQQSVLLSALRGCAAGRQRGRMAGAIGYINELYGLTLKTRSKVNGTPN